MRVIKENTELNLSKNIPFVVYFLLPFNDIQYSKVATAINCKYCCSLDVFDYQKILRMASYFKYKTFFNREAEKEEFLKGRVESVLNDQEKLLFNVFLNKYENGQLILPLMNDIEQLKNKKIRSEAYISQFLSME